MTDTPRKSTALVFPDSNVRAVPAITRGFAILRYLSQCDEPVGVQACARAVGMIPSTCLHILRALVAQDAVAFDASTKRYSLGLGLLAIGSTVLRRKNHLRIIQDELDAIANSHGLTALLARIVDSDHSLVVAISHGSQAMRFNVGIGSRYPTLIGASGRCFAAFCDVSQAELSARFKQLNWSRRPSIAQWRKDVALTRMKGFACDVGNYIEGATVIAAPVLDHMGRLTSTVAAVGLSERVRARTDEIGALLKRSAEHARSLS